MSAPSRPTTPVTDDPRLVGPASAAQEGLWILDQQEPGTPLYNVGVSSRITGRLDVGLFGRCLDHVVARHPGLRTTFSLGEDGVVQVVSAPEPGALRVVAVQPDDLPSDVPARTLHEEEIRRPFDLVHGPLFRALLVEMDPEEHLLVLTLHHIVCDATSMATVVTELSALYNASVRGQRPHLATLTTDPIAWARQEQAALSTAEGDRRLDRWRSRLADLPALDLPVDRRPARLSRGGALIDFDIGGDAGRAISDLARAERSTPFTVYLAAFVALMSRYTGGTDIPLGSTISARDEPALDGIVGLLVETQILRTNASGDPSFGELLQRCRDVVLTALSDRVPFSTLVRDIAPDRRRMQLAPLVQVVFTVDPTSRGGLQLDGLEVAEVARHTATARFDLTVAVTDAQGSPRGVAEYASDLFQSSTVQTLVDSYIRVLRQAVDRPDLRISQLDVMSAGDQHKVLAEWSGEADPPPTGRRVHELFEEAAASRPTAVAVRDASTTVTYGELDERANRPARHLRQLGAGPEQLVGIAFERSVDAVLAILAVWKSGAAYVPLDPSHPHERLALLMRQAGLGLVVTAARHAPAFDDPAVRVVRLDDDWPSIAREPATRPPPTALADNPACVVFTSGSTGAPKGVVTLHRGLERTFVAAELLAEPSAPRVLQISPLNWDGSTLEIWLALARGGEVVVGPPSHSSADSVASAILDGGVTVAHLPTGLFNVMVDTRPDVFGPLRQVFTGGEAVSSDHIRRAMRASPGTVIVNGCGPTETTVFACTHSVTADDIEDATVPIGRPMPGTRVWVLDRYGQPVPPGVPGELYVGGACLARGYLGPASLTAERFVPDHLSGQQGGRIYRTGDIVRFDERGNVVVIGRSDDQLKVRGFRVEPAEVEAALHRHPDVVRCVVVGRRGSDATVALVAYYTARRRGDDLGLRRFLAERLPSHLVPSAFIELGSLPLKANGKVDRSRLPAVDRAAHRSPFRPATPVEEAIAEMWTDLLAVDEIPDGVGFFELGGHSLLAIRLVARIADELEADIPVSAVFETPTIDGLAEIVTASASDPASRPPPLVPRGGTR